MGKQVAVKTSSGTKLYKISQDVGTYYCMKYIDSFFGSWSDIGRAKSFEDALSFIESHARKYGSIYGVNID